MKLQVYFIKCLHTRGLASSGSKQPIANGFGDERLKWGKKNILNGFKPGRLLNSHVIVLEICQSY